MHNSPKNEVTDLVELVRECMRVDIPWMFGNDGDVPRRYHKLHYFILDYFLDRGCYPYQHVENS